MSRLKVALRTVFGRPWRLAVGNDAEELLNPFLAQRDILLSCRCVSSFLPVVSFSDGLCEPQQRRDSLRGVSCFCLLQVKDSQADGLLQVAPGVVGVANERLR